MPTDNYSFVRKMSKTQKLYFFHTVLLKDPISRLLKVRLPTHFVKMGHICKIYVEIKTSILIVTQSGSTLRPVYTGLEPRILNSTNDRAGFEGVYIP